MADEQQSDKGLTIHTIPEKYYLGKKPKGGSKGALIALVVLLVVALGLGAAYILTRTGENANTANTLANGNANEPLLNRNRANQNQNENSNANAANQNTNGNANGNGNLNAANANAVTNSIFSGNTNTSTNTNSVRIPDSPDADRDGLTDVEEFLYGTGKDSPDSDADGFVDGTELANGYNPRGAGRLADTNLVKSYSNPSFAYSILYPTTWTASPNPQSATGTIFSTDTGEFFSVDVEANPAKLSARDWYLKASPGVDTRSIASIQNTVKTLEGVLSLNGQTAYYVSGETAYIIAYNTNLLSTANFRKTFEMSYRSFTLSAVPSPSTNTNTTTNTQSTNTNTTTNANTNTANVNSNSNISVGQ